jgi:hypothetical protein
MQYIYRKYGDSQIRKIFRDKAKFLEVFNTYIKRQWMLWDESTEDSKQKLELMLRSFDCIVKPLDGTLGAGVKKINKNSVTDIDDFIRHNLSEHKYVIEECITTHQEIAEFHPASLNSIQVVAGEAAIMQTFRYYGEMIDLKGWTAEKFLNKMKFKIFRILNEISNF